MSMKLEQIRIENGIEVGAKLEITRRKKVRTGTSEKTAKFAKPFIGVVEDIPNKSIFTIRETKNDTRETFQFMDLILEKGGIEVKLLSEFPILTV